MFTFVNYAHPFIPDAPRTINTVLTTISNMSYGRTSSTQAISVAWASAATKEPRQVTYWNAQIVERDLRTRMNFTLIDLIITKF